MALCIQQQNLLKRHELWIYDLLNKVQETRILTTLQTSHGKGNLGYFSGLQLLETCLQNMNQFKKLFYIL